MKRRGAFTLVELLVVIGIIALLIGILMPALNKAKEQAKMVQCMNTCKNMAQGAMLHALDHRGYFPLAGLQHVSPTTPSGLNDGQEKKYSYYSEGNTRRPMPMASAIARSLKLPYRYGTRSDIEWTVKQPGFQKYFTCPSQANVPMGATMRGADGFDAPKEMLSYVFNEAFLGRREDGKGDTPRANSTRVKMASMVILFGDGLPRADGSDWMTLPETTGNQYLERHMTMYDYHQMHMNSYKNLDFQRHKNRMNIVFVDGHVETVYIPDGLKQVGLTKYMYE